MNVIERARSLRAEANSVMEHVELAAIFEPYGGIFPTGSYLLDLMMYPDIDVYVPPMTIEQIFTAGARLAACPLVHEVIFSKTDLPNLPGGLYLKPRIDYGNWGRPWKIDIWSIDWDLIDEKLAEMGRIAAALTPELGERILDISSRS